MIRLPRAARHLVRRNALVYRHAWRGSLFFSFLQPLLFLLALGVGLGGLIDAQGGLPGGLPFLHFLAPGLLAATCMQTASFESSFPIAGKMTWRRNYEAIVATPMGVTDVVLGELLWVGVRLTMVAAVFLGVLAIFGVPRSPMALLAVPAAVLTGLAFAAPIMAYAGWIDSSATFNAMFRFVITPLFLFSGVFFPVSRLPEALQAAAWATPLFHGVELTRALVLDAPFSPAWIAHVAYLLALMAAGLAAARRTFRRKLHA
jgi:lipooligosaccharide transport system permease protein